MNLTEDCYVPSLRWRQAEFQALFRLRQEVKDRIVPLLTIPPLEFDFETNEFKKSVHEHVYSFANKFDVKWGARPAWIGFDQSIVDEHMDDGTHVYEHVFAGLRFNGANCVPAVPLALAPDTLAAVRYVVTTDGNGVGIVLSFEDLMGTDLRDAVDTFAYHLDASPDKIDVIVDLGAPNFEPYDVFANVLSAAFGGLGDLGRFRNFVLIATAYPKSFADIAKGTDAIPRHDWLFYQRLLARLPTSMRRPVYGDHTIVHPSFVATDMRRRKPAGKVAYTTPTSWVTRKGGAFMDNREQMHEHCTKIVADEEFGFRGAGFSYGDEYIQKCAARTESPSNLGRWKNVGINHHLTSVVDDLASLFGSPSPP